MSGYDYIPYVTFITTFWTATRLSQQANFNAQLELLKKDCRKTFGVQQLHFYQHGRGYNADWEVTESFLDSFEESGRTQMAQNARDIIARHYCSPNASANQAVTPKIVQELRDGIPIYETDAGRALGLQPTSNEQHREAFD
ncbi:uncharacterized protein N7484_004804 [Penicillium longicatenatum]|uniref:uncharacterized protein n=1 Tax=Penicillium longicatenatum TaxID=1561947 RepID=UPI0025475D92|nr:uncharacterized protein N7484_004804 [Penicillium longicatenatum]KAJ5651081.1 hypothetical protein N7484_004804 [Penicillium longicatenatum]